MGYGWHVACLSHRIALLSLVGPAVQACRPAPFGSVHSVPCIRPNMRRECEKSRSSTRACEAWMSQVPICHHWAPVCMGLQEVLVCPCLHDIVQPSFFVIEFAKDRWINSYWALCWLVFTRFSIFLCSTVDRDDAAASSFDAPPERRRCCSRICL